MSSALLNAVAQGGLTKQQQNAVEDQIATASMDEINYQVGMLQTEFLQRIFPLQSICCVFVFFLFLPLFRIRVEVHASIIQRSLDTLAC